MNNMNFKKKSKKCLNDKEITNPTNECWGYFQPKHKKAIFLKTI